MYTRTRRPQGFQVKKRKIQRPLDYFAQNGIQIPVTEEETDPVKVKAKKDVENFMDNLALPEGQFDASRPYESQRGPLAGESGEDTGFLSYLMGLPGEAYDAVIDYFSGEDEAKTTRLSHPKRVYTPGEGRVNLLTEDAENFEREEKAEKVDRLVRGEPTSIADRLLKGVAAERYPDVTDFSQLDKFNMVVTGTETGTFDKPTAYKTRQRTGSGAADGVGGGFYQVDKATMETDKRRGINLAKMIGGAEGEKLRKFYESIDTSVRGSEQSPEVQEALFMAHMLEDDKTKVGDILRSGNLSPEEQKKIFEENWYEGIHRPTQKQRNTPGYREGRMNLLDSYFDKFQATQSTMDAGGRLEEGDPIDPKKMAMYNEAFKKTMGENYENVPPEMMANITNLVAGGDLLSKTDQINAQLVELRKLGLDTNLLFENLAEAEGGGFGAKMKYGAAARMFSE